MAKQQEPISTKPQQVALLLPLSGSFKAQAEAVKEGFMAAWYADTITLPRPDVKFYDANSSNIVQTYQQVITAGANFVVGPLEKETVNTLVNNQSYLPVPTIALNSLENSPSRVNFYQFALLPEDEARDAAIRARNDGLSMAAAFVPEGEWGARVLKAFQQEWVKRGGKLQIVRNYSQQGFENNIKQAMLTAQVDMVFLAASPPFARQIRPLLRNFGNGNLPIYSTSHVYTGTVDVQNDRELEGIRFGDMPWVLTPDDMGRQLQSSIQQSSPEGMTQFKRLYAFGIDAYNLLVQLASLKAQSSMQLQAYTGGLSLDGNGIVHRQMSWAQFVNGQPVLLDSFSRP
jgi:outer membrane PBP1 activator LpoA protein